MHHNSYSSYKSTEIDWLEAIPSHWEARQLKFICQINPEVLPETTALDFELEYIDISNITSKGQLIELQKMRFENAPSRARRIVQHGDTILSTVRTYLKSIAFIHQPVTNVIVSTGFAVLRPQNNTIPKYLYYLVNSEEFVNAVTARSTGVNYPAISPSVLSNLMTWLPPLSEQQTIINFLDQETFRLDSLIEKKQKLIDLLQEKQATIISHAITEGLNPDVPMKDSSIPAFGQIPQHWNLLRNKVIFKEVNDRSTIGDEELLTVSHITGVTPRAEKDVTMFMAESLVGYKQCQPNDLIINTMWAWMGALGMTKYAGVVSPSYNVYRLQREYVPQYLDYLYRTPAHICEIKRHSKGVWTSRLRLYPMAFFNMYTLTPPLSEQQEIVEYISEQLRSTNAFIAKLRKSIEKLQEYRTALISAAVTGKIDVRDFNSTSSNQE